MLLNLPNLSKFFCINNKVHNSKFSENKDKYNIYIDSVFILKQKQKYIQHFNTCTTQYTQSETDMDFKLKQLEKVHFLLKRKLQKGS